PASEPPPAPEYASFDLDQEVAGDLPTQFIDDETPAAEEAEVALAEPAPPPLEDSFPLDEAPVPEPPRVEDFPLDEPPALEETEVEPAVAPAPPRAAAP